MTFVSPDEAEVKTAQSAERNAQLAAQKAKLAQSTLAVNDCLLRAPFDGEIATRSLDPGAFVHPGTPIVTIIDRSTVRLVADAPESDFEILKAGKPVRVRVYATKKEVTGSISRRAPSTDDKTRTIQFEVDIPDPNRDIPTNTTGEIHISAGEPVPATVVPLYAAYVREDMASVFVVKGDTVHRAVFHVTGEIGGSLFVDTSLPPGTPVVLEGRELLEDGDHVAATAASQSMNDIQRPEAPLARQRMTSLSLRNPIAILMLCIALVVFAFVVTPRMSVDTFPELTPPVLIVGTLAPGLGPKDVEKTISWRLEKYVSATPGVDHVESISRNSLSIIYVWLKWGTDLNGAQTLVQQQAAFAMAAIPKSLGVLPPFVLQYDPSNAPVVQVVVSGAGYTGPQLYDYAFNYIEPLLEGIHGVASAAPDGGRMRQINVVVDPIKAQARNVTAEEVAAAVAKSNALLPSGEFISPKFDANVYTNAIPHHVTKIGDAPVKVVDKREVLIHDVAYVEDGGTPADAIRLG